MTNKTWNHLNLHLNLRKTAVVTLTCLFGAFAFSGASALAAETEAAVQTETSAADAVIGAEAAKNFAFADAGVDPAAAEYVSAKYDYDDGEFLYDVEFTAEGTEYEYHVQAYDGSILKKSVEYEALKSTLLSSGTTSENTATISLEEAKEIALADTLLTEEEIATVIYTKEKEDYDDGLSVYDIEFYTDEKQYEYEISVLTGDILSLSEELLPAAVSGSQGSATSAADASGSTSGTASGSENSESSGNSESAENSESTGHSQNSQDAQDTYISVDKAKSIALAKAGLSSEDVTFKKAKLGREDGVMVYEIEFYHGKTEYEFEINAVTGEIREYEVD
ncbi:MAG: PepSY domain-containing protein [Lachnospiraceae bacterium]|nr:PepSY domain-containing protein [Lachnospiraceae bacterium]